VRQKAILRLGDMIGQVKEGYVADLLLVDVPVAGVTTMQWAIARTPSLLAQTFHHQVVPFELGAGGGITAVTASNAWAMTIGAW
jgi:hypothetical protein